MVIVDVERLKPLWEEGAHCARDDPSPLLKDLEAASTSEALAFPLPVLELSISARLTRANRLALWLWGADASELEPFVWYSPFEVFARNAWRLAVENNRKCIELAFKLDRLLSNDASLADWRRENPAAQEVYTGMRDWKLHKHDLDYPLVISEPQLAAWDGRTPYSPIRLLSFKASVLIKTAEDGTRVFLTAYLPTHSDTESIIQAMLTVDDFYGTQRYVISLLKEKGGESIGVETEQKRPSVFNAEFVAAKRAQGRRWDRYTTVIFNDEEHWGRFLSYAFNEFKGSEGLAFTDSPLPMSARVGPDLLELAFQRFDMRLVTPEAEQEYLDGLMGDRAFDPQTLRHRHVPAVEYFRRMKRS